jgi:hypothetical protein
MKYYKAVTGCLTLLQRALDDRSVFPDDDQGETKGEKGRHG